MRRFAPLCLVLLLLAVAGFGVAQLAEVRKLNATITDLNQERDGWQKRLANLQKLNADLAARLSRGTRATSGGAASDGPDSPPFPGDNAGPQGRGRWGAIVFAAAMSTPEAMRLMSLQQRAALDGRYAPSSSSSTSARPTSTNSRACSWRNNPRSWT